VASEPLDELEQWEEIPPDNWVLIGAPDSVEVEPIPDLPPRRNWK
jgi:hypothetical protein